MFGPIELYHSRKSPVAEEIPEIVINFMQRLDELARIWLDIILGLGGILLKLKTKRHPYSLPYAKCDAACAVCVVKPGKESCFRFSLRWPDGGRLPAWFY